MIGKWFIQTCRKLYEIHLGRKYHSQAIVMNTQYDWNSQWKNITVIALHNDEAGRSHSYFQVRVFWTMTFVQWPCCFRWWSSWRKRTIVSKKKVCKEIYLTLTSKTTYPDEYPICITKSNENESILLILSICRFRRQRQAIGRARLSVVVIHLVNEWEKHILRSIMHTVTLIDRTQVFFFFAFVFPFSKKKQPYSVRVL